MSKYFLLRKIVFSFAVAGTLTASAQQTFYWLPAANTTGQWSSAGSWSGAGAAAAGGGADYTLVFSNSAVAPWGATNDLAGVYLLNSLVLANASTTPTLLLSGGTLAFTNFGATLPSLLQNGAGPVRINNNLLLAADTTFGGTGGGAVTLGGAISGSGQLTKANTNSVFIVNNSVAHSGGTVVQAGKLLWQPTLVITGQFGSGMITLDGGTFGFNANSASGTHVLSNAFLVTGNNGTIDFGRIANTQTLTLVGGLVLDGNLGLFSAGTATFVTRSPLTLTNGNRTIFVNAAVNGKTVLTNITEDGTARTLTLVQAGSQPLELVGDNTGLTGGIIVSNTGSGVTRFLSTASLGGGGNGSVTVRRNSYAGLQFNFGGTDLDQFAPEAGAIIGIESNSSVNLDLVTRGWDVRIGSSQTVTYKGTLTPFGTVYKLGGGGGGLTLPNTNALTGSRSVDVGTQGPVAGNTVTLTASNDYTGGTLVSAGTLSTTVAGALGTGQLRIRGGNVTLSSSNAFNGTILFQGQLLSITHAGGYTGSNLVIRADQVLYRTWNVEGGTKPTAQSTASGLNIAPFGSGTISLDRGVLRLAPSVAGATTISQPIRFGGDGHAELFLADFNTSSSVEWTAPSLVRSNQGGLFITWSGGTGNIGDAGNNARFLISGQATTNLLPPYIVTSASSGSRNATFAQYTANGLARATLTAAPVVGGVVTAPLNDGTEILNMTNGTTATLGANLDVLALRMNARNIGLNRNNGAGYTNIIIRSGGLMTGNNISGVTIQPDLYFGTPGSPVEAVIWASSGQFDSLSGTILSGSITANGLTKLGSLTKDNDTGVGRTYLQLTGNNNILGRVAAVEGGIVIGSAGALNNSNTVFTTSAGEIYFNVNETLAGLEGTGGLGTSANGSSAFTRQLTLITPTNTTYSSAIGLRDESTANSRFLALTKDGPGTQVLTGTNTYTGATRVNNGTLALIGSLAGNGGIIISNGANLVLEGAIGSGSGITIVSGGTFVAAGTISQSATVQNGATLTVGSSPGKLTVNNLTLQPNATLVIEVLGPTAGTEFDQIEIPTTGSFAFDQANLLISNVSTTITAGMSFTIVHNTSGGEYLTSYFVGAPEGSTTNFGSPYLWQITYQSEADADGVYNDIVLTLVQIPEPSAWVLTAGGLLLLLALRRRS